MKLYMSKKTGQTFVTIPKAIVKAKNLQDKQEVEWLIDNLGQLILKIKA